MEAEAREILSAAVRPRRLLREVYERTRPFAAELELPDRSEEARGTDL
ncbi:hypothetical protein [Nocardia salmonicida]